MREEWRDVPGYEGRYQVSSLGSIRSVGRQPGMKKPSKHPMGYMRITLSRNGVLKTYFVHVLVLRAFAGEPKGGQESAHLNGCRTDNRLINLKWTSRKENHAHKVEHGTAQRGEKHGASKFTDSQVLDIRARVRAGAKQSAIAAEFGVSFTTINDIVRGRRWTHLPV